MRRTSRFAILAWGWSLAAIAAGAGPADGLFRLVPPDAGATLAIEDLRTHWRQIGDAPLLASLRKIPAVRAWLGSDRFVQLAKAGRDIEAALGVSLATLRDELVGDAVVLIYMPGPPDAPEQSTGLLLARPRDLALLRRLIDAWNAAQKKGGELLGVEKKNRGPLAYTSREYKPGGRPTEYYIQLDDGTFAWSNSERLIQGVIDRKLEGRPCLKDNLEFLKVRRGLPESAVASLYVNPKLVEAAVAGLPLPDRPAQERLLAMFARYLTAVGYAGAALEWRDGLLLHTHEAVDPAKLEPWLKGWLSRPASRPTSAREVPDSALAVVAAHVDFEAARDVLWELTPEDDRPRLENLKVGLQGLLLGEDPNAEVLPRLGPGVLAYMDARPEPDGLPLFPIVGVVGWANRPGEGELAAPIDNAFRTGLAFYAFDPRRRARHLRVESRRVGDSATTTLTDGIRTVLAYRVDRDRLVLGNGVDAISRLGATRPPTVISGVRERYFPEVETFAVVDLIRLCSEARRYRGPIARRLAARSRRPVNDVDRDLGQVLVMLELFRAASSTSVAEQDASSVHRTLGLIAR